MYSYLCVLYVYAYISVSAPCVYMSPQRSEGDIQSPGIRVTDGREPPCD